MIVKIHKYDEYDNGDDYKLFKHIGQQKECAGYGQQQYPANVPGV
jgi:hypothetical protein